MQVLECTKCSFCCSSCYWRWVGDTVLTSVYSCSLSGFALGEGPEDIRIRIMHEACTAFVRHFHLNETV